MPGKFAWVMRQSVPTSLLGQRELPKKVAPAVRHCTYGISAFELSRVYRAFMLGNAAKVLYDFS